MTTVLNIIEGAARLIGALNKGENLSADDAADGLVALNDLVASWANDSLLVTARTEETFSLVAGVASYTIGPSKTFNTARPIVILEAQIRDSGGLDYPVTIISDEEYQDIQFKSTSDSLPQYLNYDNGYPFGTINLYATPSVAYSIRLLSEKPLTSFTSTSQTVDLPPGWNKALRFNLAVDMAPEFIKPNELDPLVIQGAKDSKGAIKAAVLKNRPLLTPATGGRGARISIYSGDF